MADYNSTYTGAQIDEAVGKANKLPVEAGDAGYDQSGAYLRYLQNEYTPNGTWVRSSPLDLFQTDFFFYVPITMDEYFNLSTDVSVSDYVKAQNFGKTIIGVLNDTYQFILHPIGTAGRYGYLPAFDYSTLPVPLDDVGFSGYMGTLNVYIVGLADDDPQVGVSLHTWQGAQPT